MTACVASTRRLDPMRLLRALGALDLGGAAAADFGALADHFGTRNPALS